MVPKADRAAKTPDNITLGSIQTMGSQKNTKEELFDEMTKDVKFLKGPMTSQIG